VAFTNPERTELSVEFAIGLGIDGTGASTVSMLEGHDVAPAGEGVAAVIVRSEAVVRHLGTTFSRAIHHQYEPRCTEAAAGVYARMSCADHDGLRASLRRRDAGLDGMVEGLQLGVGVCVNDGDTGDGQVLGLQCCATRRPSARLTAVQ
jgi:hypothetical protein